MQFVMEPDHNPKLERYNKVMPPIDSYLKLKKVPKHKGRDGEDKISRDGVKEQLGKVVMDDPDYSVVKEDDILQQVRVQTGHCSVNQPRSRLQFAAC